MHMACVACPPTAEFSKHRCLAEGSTAESGGGEAAHSSHSLPAPSVTARRPRQRAACATSTGPPRFRLLRNRLDRVPRLHHSPEASPSQLT